MISEEPVVTGAEAGRWKIYATAAGAVAAAVVFALTVMTVSLEAAINPVRAEQAATSLLSPTAGQAMPTAGPVTAAEPITSGVTEYYLPYPGILPDNPLYKLKAVRDRLSLWLERDEEKKARKELLYADKRINAARFLAEGGKPELSVTTATKAEKYLEQAVNRGLKLDAAGREAGGLLTDLTRSSRKHLELLQGLREKTCGEESAGIDAGMASTKLGQERLEQRLREKQMPLN